VSDYLKKELEIKTYIPFLKKKQIAEMIASAYTEEVDGVKKHDSICAYVGLIAASITAHTNLEFSKNVFDDYDLLAERGLLSQIVAEFQESHGELDILLKMAIASELEDNNINVLIGKFLNKLSTKIDVFGDALKNKLDNLDPATLLGTDITKEDLTKLSGIFDKLK
jgi:pyrroloquinoline quinone (PQQ) biosynthesis protein C